MKRNGGPVTSQREPHYTVTEAQLRWRINVVGAHRGKSLFGLWHELPHATGFSNLNVQKTLAYVAHRNLVFRVQN